MDQSHNNHERAFQYLSAAFGADAASSAADGNSDLFSQASQLVHAFHRAFQARLGLSGAEWRFLIMMLQHHEHIGREQQAGGELPEQLITRMMQEGISQKEMQELLGIDRAMVTRLAKQFEAEGLIRRAADPKDNRLTLLYLTEAGMQMHYDVPRKLATFWQEATQGMSGAEIEGLHHALSHLSANLAAMAGRGEADAPGE